MKKNLNKLLEESEDRVICSGVNGQGSILLSQLKLDVRFNTKRILLRKESAWLLSVNEPYFFLVGLLSLLLANKKVVISANRKVDWLTGVSDAIDGVLADNVSEFDGLDKPKIRLEGSTDLDSIAFEEYNYPKISGEEVLLFFTSGSTGNAKIIEKKLSQLTNEVKTLNNSFTGISQDVVFASSVSHFHIYGLLFNLLWPFLTNRVWLNGTVEFQEQLENIQKGTAKLVFVSSPAFLSRLEEGANSHLIEFLFSSGGPLKYETAHQSEVLFGSLPIEVYGSTETGGIAYRQQESKSSLWNLFSGVELTPVEGDVYLRSPHIPEGTSVQLDDKLELQNQEQFLLHGRKDRIVKIEEKRISLTEIECFLLQSDRVCECVALLVFGKRTVVGCALVLSDKGCEELKAIGEKGIIASLKNGMKQRFETVTIPRKWRLLTRLPMNTQGKIEMNALQTLFCLKKESVSSDLSTDPKQNIK